LGNLFGVSEVMEDKTKLMKDETPPLSRPLHRASTYSVYPCDGFATSFVLSSDDAVLQFSFWMQDITPDAEDLGQKINEVGRYVTSLKTTFCTAVKLNPNTALQLAVNILENLEALPKNVKERYDIPQNLENVQSH
jgi:hypothetical protein